MGIRVSTFSVTVGESQQLEVARGEDREIRITFEIDDAAVDLTGATAVVMTVRNRSTGIAVFARAYSGFQGAATAGTPRFQILQADTLSQADGPYDVDVSWTDASGYKTQLLIESTFLILPRVGAPGDSITTPPAIPVVYGLNWRDGWSSPSGGYLLNDAVFANDGSIGASAAGVTCISTFRCIASGTTYYPVNASLLVATGWQYVGQHGGVGATGPGSQQAVTGVKSTGYSAIYGDFVRCNPTGGTFLIWLPFPTGSATGLPITVKNQSASNNSVLVYAPSGFNVNSTGYFPIEGAFTSMNFKADGFSGWMTF